MIAAMSMKNYDWGNVHETIMTEAMSMKKRKKLLTELLSMVKFSSMVFRVFMLTDKQQKTKNVTEVCLLL